VSGAATSGAATPGAATSGANLGTTAGAAEDDGALVSIVTVARTQPANVRNRIITSAPQRRHTVVKKVVRT